MIHHLNGRLISKSPTEIVVECGGVGYIVHISLFTYDKLPSDESIKILVHPIIKEDSHTLFGFMDNGEREMFKLLISVSGVGANTARLVLSSLSTEELVSAIATENEETFKKIKGIGVKSAKRLILELKDKVGVAAVDLKIPLSANNTKLNEALSGLMVLGFDKNKANKVLESLTKDGDDWTVEELIKQALKKLF